ncbi:MAG: thiamine phosphate synthase [Bacteroidales bacterium]|nr:thiamine phosphate synthase [Bacteroidales bacterium]
MIVITAPGFVSDEAKKINLLFEEGIRRLHMRKPDATSEEVGRLVAQIDERWYERISVHYHFDVAEAFSLGGVHLSGRTPEAPKRWTGLISASCHSLEEIELRKTRLDYCFLSPIFDSISKEGYKSAFTTTELEAARDRGLIDNKVIALGGINEENIKTVRDLGFGDYAVLGAIWKGQNSADIRRLLEKYHIQ